MKTIMDFADMPDEQEITLTKHELLELGKEESVGFLMNFMAECKEMAEANWCPAMVNDLQRLFNAVITNEPYAPEPEEE